MPSLIYGIPAFLLIINLATGAAFVLERHASADGRPRISPGLLMLCVALGGGLGMVVAILPVLNDEGRQPLSPVILTIVGLQVGVAAGFLAFFL